MSYLSQMAGLAVQNFVSAALGMAVLAAVIRGFARRSASTVGNFWVDLYRSLVYILAAARARSSPAARLAGRRPDLRRRGDRDDARGRRADDRARPGRDADRDQAARDERRRLLQLELGRAVREPERASRTCSRCSRSCSFPPRRSSCSAGWSARAGRRCPIYGAMMAMFAIGIAIALPAEQHGSQVLRDSGVNITRRRRLERRQHVRQGGALRDRVDRELGGRDDERLQRLRQRRPRRAHRRPAAPCRS